VQDEDRNQSMRKLQLFCATNYQCNYTYCTRQRNKHLDRPTIDI